MNATIDRRNEGPVKSPIGRDAGTLCAQSAAGDSTRKSKRQTRAEQVLSDPAIQRYLAAEKALAKSQDTNALVRLFKLMTGRTLHGSRCGAGKLCKERLGLTLRRGSVDVAWRYLRRVRGGTWHKGGSHVARLNFGPGIAFPDGRGSDRDERCWPELINVTLALPENGEGAAA